MKKIYAKFLFWLENYLQKRGKKFKNKKQNFYRIFLSFLYINIVEKLLSSIFTKNIDNNGTSAKGFFAKSRQDHYDELSPLGKKIHDIFIFFMIFVIALVWSAPWIFPWIREALRYFYGVNS
jgi:hypothetical protein